MDISFHPGKNVIFYKKIIFGGEFMARSSFQKLKILYISDYLTKNSDEEHPVSVSRIIAYLDSVGISAERKSIYDDIEALREYGLDVIQTGSGKSSGYYVGSREFELPELKLLVDSVQSAKFITQKKTVSLIKKLENLTSVNNARALSRQVYVQNRAKAMNESIYYNVDTLHTAIGENSRIRFHYFEYTVEKKRRFRRDGGFYEISPFALTWEDENYYLIGYDSEAKILKHFRVDKMTDISLTGEPRDGTEVYAGLDMAAYAKKVFGMFSGDQVPVKMRFENRLIGAVMDKLGQEIMPAADGDGHFTVRADVAVSPQFFGWICGFGAQAEILDPPAVVEQFREHINGIAGMYK
jgi:predicted DNA-binding transcriptional regulator YafY